MKRFGKKLFSIIVILLIITIGYKLLTSESLAYNQPENKSARGKDIIQYFVGDALASRYYPEHARFGAPGAIYLLDYKLSHILCTQHGTGIPLDEPDECGHYPTQVPRVTVTFDIEGDKYGVSVTLPKVGEGEDAGYTEWNEHTWPEGGEDDEAHIIWTDDVPENGKGTQDKPDSITITLNRLYCMHNYGHEGEPAPSSEAEVEETTEGDTECEVDGLFTNSYAYSTVFGDEQTHINDAIAYLYSECNFDGGHFPSGSYVNVASWLLQDNTGAYNANIDTNYFTSSTDDSSDDGKDTYWMYKEQKEKLEKELEDFLASHEDDDDKEADLRRHIAALEDTLKALENTSGGDGVSEVGKATALDAASVYEEAIIFAKMWKDIGKGGYAATVEDKTTDVAGQNYELLHAQFHTEKDSSMEAGAVGNYDTYYIVGPFKIKYLEYYTPVDKDGNGGQLCGMCTDPDYLPILYARISGTETELSYETDYIFEYSKNNEFLEDSFTHERKEYPHIPTAFNNTGLPHSEETFFLKIRYQEGMQEITKMTFNFRYLSAKCHYQRYTNWLWEQEWSASAKLHTCKDGKTCDCKDDGKGGTLTWKQKTKGHDIYSYCNGGTAATNCSHGNAHGKCTEKLADGTTCPGGNEATTCTHGETSGHYYVSSHCDGGTPCTHGSYRWHYDYVEAEVNCKENNQQPKDIQDYVYVKDADRDDGEDGDGDGERENKVVPITMNWKIDLTTVLDGWVWQDKEQDKASSRKIGVWEKGEEDPIENVEVYVYLYSADTGEKVDDAKIYSVSGDTWTAVQQPLYSSASGEWNPNKYRFEAPGKQQHLFYVAEFRYDGQYFRDTFYLSNGASEDYRTEEPSSKEDAEAKAYGIEMNLSSAERSKAVTSYTDREAFDLSFGIIEGKSPMSGGETQGNALTTNATGEEGDGNKDLQYKAGTYQETDRQISNIAVSRLDEPMYEYEENKQQQKMNTEYYEQFSLSAWTYQKTGTTGGLVTVDKYQMKYPQKTVYFLDKIKNENNNVNSPHYADEYMRHINLGLAKRAETDLSVVKDLYKVTIVVNEQKLEYKFSPYGLTTGDFVQLVTDLDTLKQNQHNGYALGLYESDLKYSSAEHYSSAIDRVKQLKENTELRVFASYSIRLYNNSELDEVSFNEVTDYSEPNFTLVQNGTDYTLTDDGKLQTSIVNDQMKRETTTIAEAPYYRICSQDQVYTWGANKDDNLKDFVEKEKGEVIWEVDKDDSHKHRTTSVRKYSDNNPIKITNNEYIEIFTTYEIDKAGYDAIRQSGGAGLEQILQEREEALITTPHINTAEISKYSTYYGLSNGYRNNKTGGIAGRIDRDSAPDNITLGTNTTYEDDTYEAPALALTFKVTEREVEGFAFEDAKNGQETGTAADYASGNDIPATQISVDVADGKFDTADGDKGVNGIKVSLYEVINLGDLDDNALGTLAGLEYYYKVPDFEQTTTYSEKYDSDGYYNLQGVLSGDYVVRFDYGSDLEKDDSNNALNKDIIYSAKARDGEQKDIVKYNGQDYENTKFLGEFLGDGAENKLNIKFLPVDGKDPDQLSGKTVSKARDNESRRLEVAGYSRTIENERAEILRDRLPTEEYLEGTKMFAETPIMKVEVEDPSQLNNDAENQGPDGHGNKEPGNDNTTIKVYEYGGHVADLGKLTTNNVKLKNINFGLEERARTDIEVKNRVKEILAIKAGDIIFDVTFHDDGTVEKDNPNQKMGRKLVSHPSTYDYNPTNNQQGFDAVELEAGYLEGLKLQIRYKSEVINNSELDFTSALGGLYRQDAIETIARGVPTTTFYEDLQRHYQDISDQILTASAAEGQFKLNTNATRALYRYLNLDDELGYDIDESQTTDTIKPEVIVYGLYVGRYYYENKLYNHNTNTGTYYINDYLGCQKANETVEPIEITYGRDKIVRTTVNNMVDYTDIDASFEAYTEGKPLNNAWTTQGVGDEGTDQVKFDANGKIEYVAGSDYEKAFKGRISDASYREDGGDVDFYDFKDRKYVNTGKSNIGYSDNEAMVEMEGNVGRVQYAENDTVNDMNPDLSRELEPIAYVLPDFYGNRSEDKELNFENIDESVKSKFLGTIKVFTAKYTNSAKDAENLIIDNMIEVLVYSNPTGRRDIFSVPGNGLAIGASKAALGRTEQGIWYSGYNSIKSANAGRNQYKATNLTDGSARANAARVINTDARKWTEYPEDDQWVPEYVTIVPPTGIAMRLFIKNNLPIVLASTLAILALAIVFIRKQIKIRRNKR